MRIARIRSLAASLVMLMPIASAIADRQIGDDATAPSDPLIDQVVEVPPPKPLVGEVLIDLTDRAEAARRANTVPAVAVAWIRDGQVVGAGVSGVRKQGSPEPVTLSDQWHIGSCTKAMTATLAGILVEKGALRWETTIGQTIPELANEMDPSYKDATLKQLLSHRSGLPSDREPTFEQGLIWSAMKFGNGDLASRRMTGVKFGLKQKPIGAPGETYAYSNLGYTIAGVMLERAAGDTYENLMAKEIFGPLGMTTAGWGPPGVADAVAQPFGHDRIDGAFVPVSPDSPAADNPAAIAPAGTLHLSILDWARFIAAHTRAGAGDLLASPRIFTVLHTSLGDDYALGWVVTQRPWATGNVLMHNGTNGHWIAFVWASPEDGTAFLAACNAADSRGAAACDQAITSLILNPPAMPE